MLEEFSLILGTIASFFGIVASFGLFTQSIKIFKRKSSADLSLTTYLLFFVNGLIWLAYGISLNNIFLIIPNIVGSIGMISVLILYFVYKK